jgi:hypothetical protein
MDFDVLIPITSKASSSDDLGELVFENVLINVNWRPREIAIPAGTCSLAMPAFGISFEEKRVWIMFELREGSAVLAGSKLVPGDSMRISTLVCSKHAVCGVWQTWQGWNSVPDCCGGVTSKSLPARPGRRQGSDGVIKRIVRYFGRDGENATLKKPLNILSRACYAHCQPGSSYFEAESEKIGLTTVRSIQGHSSKS